MKLKILTLAVVAAGLVALAPQARADGPSWGVGFGIGFGGANVSGFVGSPHHRHFRPGVIVAPAPVYCAPPRQVPIYQSVWVPARYQQVFVGYDRCGAPIYRTVCVSGGHYEQVIVGYRTC
jgi:hypothetical protein